ncbi:farnesyl pyrophosphate synthase-like [Solenopsis invicta]|uniref:farnesyl pyrophosphate synthase-like n=1 Tax=Solenopsis invicta TaxID=13686 RepID=UPI00193DC848|nr:farnesyl pyrophosphate synthase-like [Solenopsis invicta]
MIDDVLDQAIFCRDKPCWYRHDGTNLMAINDALLLQNSVYYLIEKHFKRKECNINLVETFLQATFDTQIGQFLDMSSTSKKFNLDRFTMNRYNSIAYSKSSEIAFLMPVFLAMHYAGIEKVQEMFKQSETILLELGQFYQIQNDCLGCFFDLRKDNTDIEEGKCTWLIVKALELVTPEQRKTLEECYGVLNPKKTKRVKQLYIDLNLQNAYFKHEKETYNAITALIEKIPCKNLHFLIGLLEKLYGRQICFG